MADKVFKLSEVAEHNTRASTWMVIHNKVYDVTEFLVEHPGGEEVLLDLAGKDGTESFEDVGHSKDARDMLKSYYKGDLHEDDVKANPQAGNFSWLPEDKKEGKDSNTTIIVVGAILALAIGIAYKYVIASGI